MNELARFDDRYTMRHVREYPHPIERVFEAVTTASHLDAWMMPECHVEARLHGKWSFTFGSIDGTALEGTIIAFDPPHLVDYGGLRFELEAVGGGTRLTFIQSFPPGFRHGAPENAPGFDLPAGEDTPWRPGFVAGYHQCLDALAEFLDGILDPHASAERIGKYHRQVYDAVWLELIEMYRQYIAHAIPPR
jgi:uncharacterized protein YndB with AHSA1/START domain